MCPVCVATAVLIAAGTGSTAGLGALIVRNIRSRSSVKNSTPVDPKEGDRHESPNGRDAK
jgi:hypothetical protein